VCRGPFPFCQFHADFRVREVEFILRFTEASALILPRQFRRFDYLDMLGRLRPNLPHLRHVLVVGEDLTAEYLDLRRFLDAPDELPLDRELPHRRRPKGNDLARTAFTSGTTGDPKAVLHLHNTTNCAARFVNEGHRIGPERIARVSAGRAQLGAAQRIAGDLRRLHTGIAGIV
jgi:acyl-coenzyme A synthetase/AMP-(fatty) acid ligase